MSKLRESEVARRLAVEQELKEQVRDLSERNPDRMTMLLRRSPDLAKRLWARWAEHPDDKQ